MALHLVILFVFSAVHNSVGIPLEEFFPFGAEAGDFLLNRMLDGSSPAISLPSPFPFFDNSNENAFVYNNGYISFDNSFSQYSPLSFPLTDSAVQLIAPYWSDVDTTPEDGGWIWYRVTMNDELRTRAASLIISSSDDFYPDYLLIATWDRVGYHSLQSSNIILNNTFQCVMATNGVSSFVIYLYADGGIQWITSDDSGGINGTGGNAALVGYNAGDGIRYQIVPQSMTPEIINISMTSNVGVPGVWVFRVDEEEISNCNNGIFSIFPRYGNMLGGTAIRGCVPSVFESDTITCSFGDVTLPGLYVNGREVLCVSPLFSATGALVLKLTIKREEEIIFLGAKPFHALSTDRAHSVSCAAPDGLLLDLFDDISISWDTDSLLLNRNSISVDIIIMVFTQSGEWVNFYNVESNQPNDGEYTIKIGFQLFDIPLCRDEENRDPVCPIVIGVQVNSVRELPNLEELSEQGIKISLWSGMYYHGFRQSTFISYCGEWNTKQNMMGVKEVLDALPPCPPDRDRAEIPNSGFAKQQLSSLVSTTSYSSQWIDFFHPGAETCYIQLSPTDQSRQQCCYNGTGHIIYETGGGTADLYGPKDEDIDSLVNHILEDLIPYVYCCSLPMSNCLSYTMYRPFGNATDYSPPLPACVYGDPHIVTLDGLKYTFNGKGEFTLIETEGDIFTLQGRMVEASGANGTSVNATVFSALVAKQTYSDTVQFELIQNGINTLVNEETVDFSDSSEQPFTNVTIMDMGNDTYSATFSSGIYIEVRRENDIISTVLVSLPTSFEGTTRGLMGSYNGDTSDDLAPRSGDDIGQPISTDSSLQEIHEQFGITWIINGEEDNLFTYSSQETFETFYDPGFSPVFEIQFTDPVLEEIAIEICEDDQFCLYDIAATQSTSIGLTTLMGGKEFETIANLSAPVTCDPPCDNGVCVDNDTCICTDGYIGATCSELVLLECDVNPCQNGGTCSLIGPNYVCDCINGFYGFFCENSPPIDCDCTSNIECSVDGNFVGNGSTEVTLNGKYLKCLIAFDNDAFELESYHVDAGFDNSQRFLSAGSLSFLNNIGVLQGRDEFSSCTISNDVISSLPTGSPSATLQEFGVNELQMQYMETDGTFESIQLSNPQVEQIVRDADYTIDDYLSAENACSFQHLIYWLATLNEPASSGSAEPADTTQMSGNGVQPPDPEVLPVSVTSTVCKQAGEDDSTTIVFPVNC